MITYPVQAERWFIGMEPERLTTAEAAAVLMVALIEHRKALSTAEAACMIGRSRSGAYRLLCQVSRKVPITIIGKRWQRI
jgi:hypothetical protein